MMATVPRGSTTVSGNLVPRNPLVITWSDEVARFEVRNTGTADLTVIGSGTVLPGTSTVFPNGQSWLESPETGSSLALAASGPTTFNVLAA